MEIQDFQDFCLKLNGVTEDLKWDHNLCFCVRDKIFCILNIDAHPLTFGIKLSPDKFEEIIQIEGARISPYLARGNWLLISLHSSLNRKEIEQLILESYEIIKGKLSKRIQAELAINN